MSTILAIVVLYKMSPEASPTYRALSAALRDDVKLAGCMDLLVVDNSPESQELPTDMVGRYLHDGTNPGLAKRYNLALREAVAVGAGWLLLLDQDTAVTAEYLAELCELAQSLRDEAKVAAVVPKLLLDGGVQSPHLPNVARYRRASQSLDVSKVGLMQGRVRVYNSGAMIRVSALEAMGGFPEAYWLDYLDHATFASLQENGGGIYLMASSLNHEMSIYLPGKHSDPGNAARQTNQLAAENRFYREHGTLEERVWHRLALAKQALRSALGKHFSEAGRYMRAAVAMDRGQA